MKTSVNMVRKLGDIEVIQRTKDGYFDANKLVSEWNKRTKEHKRIRDFVKLNNTKEFLKSLEIRLKEKGENVRPFISGKGRGNKTWMHPYMFMKFAMWLNPEFEVRVIEFVYDQLVEYRHAAGDMYKTLSKAAARLPAVNYSQLAKGLNYIVFGRHESGILRQHATREQLNELSEIQSKLAFAVDMDYIKTFDALLEEMRKIYFYKQSKTLSHVRA
jgi:hypothetical protein